MVSDAKPRRPVLALSFTVVAEQNTVHLLAGEEFRYTFSGDGLHEWLPPLLTRLDGSLTESELLADASESHRHAAVQLLERMWGERILVEAPVETSVEPSRYGVSLHGSGAIREQLEALSRNEDNEADRIVHMFCQDTLDYHAAFRFNAERLGDGEPWLWVSSGPMSRGYVSPIFFPEGGPCLGCLLGRFENLSPTPEIYDVLLGHGERGNSFTAVPFPDEASAILASVAMWKKRLLETDPLPASVVSLHVLEVKSLEVQTHRVMRDEHCPHCGEGR